MKDYLVSAAPLRVAGDRINGAVVTMVDLSQRKAAEEQQRLLMRELDHRVKNTLAMVASISARTAAKADTVEAFQKAFSGRIQALSATHNLLLRNSWSSLELRDIVRSELAPYVDDAADNVTIDGLNIAVAPRAAIAFGLIVHELTTNAVKYGALSQEGGHVAVRRSVGNQERTAPFVVEWRESGGPRVAPLERKGFGHTVITRSLQYGGGGAEFDFDPAGRCMPHFHSIRGFQLVYTAISMTSEFAVLLWIARHFDILRICAISWAVAGKCPIKPPTTAHRTCCRLPLSANAEREAVPVASDGKR